MRGKARPPPCPNSRRRPAMTISRFIASAVLLLASAQPARVRFQDRRRRMRSSCTTRRRPRAASCSSRRAACRSRWCSPTANGSRCATPAATWPGPKRTLAQRQTQRGRAHRQRQGARRGRRGRAAPDDGRQGRAARTGRPASRRAGSGCATATASPATSRPPTSGASEPPIQVMQNSTTPRKITILGAGAWGTAVAIALAARHDVLLWGAQSGDGEATRRRARKHRLPARLCAARRRCSVSADLDAALAHVTGRTPARRRC